MFPQGVYDENAQQVDLRTNNSWLYRLGQVETPEVVEVMAINAISPFIINGKLRRLMEATDPGTDKFIVNVSAMVKTGVAGIFSRYNSAGVRGGRLVPGYEGGKFARIMSKR